MHSPTATSEPRCTAFEEDQDLDRTVLKRVRQTLTRRLLPQAQKWGKRINLPTNAGTVVLTEHNLALPIELADTIFADPSRLLKAQYILCRMQ